MSLKGSIGLLTVVLASTSDAAAPKGTPVYVELPVEELATSVGGNGLTVVGTYYSGGAFFWNPIVGSTPIGGTQGVAASLDGKTIIGDALDSRGFENAAIWTGGQTWRLLGSFTPTAQGCDRLLSGAFGASYDARVIVGLGWDGCKIAHAFRWEESTGFVDLGSTVADRASRANGVSGDGQVVVGWQEDVTGYRMGAKWANGAQTVIQGPTGMLGEAFGANRDGSLIVGTTCDPFSPTASAWTWSATAGVQCFPVTRPSDLQDLPYLAYMRATSDDGRVIVGAFSWGLESESLIWFDGQVYFLKDYLRANGVPQAFEGWVNTGFALDITPDGRTLVGYGAGPTGFQGFMVVLPELSPR